MTEQAWVQAASSDNLSYVTDDEEEDHQDTVEQILKCIIENEGSNSRNNTIDTRFRQYLRNYNLK